MIRNDTPDSETETQPSTDGSAERDSQLDEAATRRGFMRLAGLVTGGMSVGLSDVSTVRAANTAQDIDDVDALNLMLRFERLHRDFYREFAEELDDALDGDHEDDEDDHEEDLEDEEDDLEDEKDEIEEELEELEDERDDHQEDEDDDEHDDDDDDEHEEEEEEDLDEREEELEEELEEVEDDLEEVRDEQDDHEDDEDDHDDDDEIEGLVEEAFEDDTGLHQDGVERFHQLADHEETHVRRVEQLIEDLGGTPDAESGFDFNDDGLGEFLATASAIGEATVRAYADIVPRIDDSDAALEAMRLCIVEARHAAFISGIDGDDPFPEPFAKRGSMTDAEEFLEQFE